MRRLTKCPNISRKDKNILLRCRESIHKISPKAKVILYGSRARGDAVPESDYDLLVLVHHPVTLKEEDIFRQQLFPIEIETGCVLTLNMYYLSDWNSVLYKGNAFLPKCRKRRFGNLKKEIRTLVLYQLNRADESLGEALILLERDHINTLEIEIATP